MRIAIIGQGKMGQMIKVIAEERIHESTFLSRENINTLDNVDCDLIIDFSGPEALLDIEKKVRAERIPLVCGTTGYSLEEMKTLEDLGEVAPVLYSSNFSVGIAIMKNILKQSSSLLMANGFDVELTEAHHKHKKDAPSGTAKTLLEIINPNGEYTYVYGREGITGERDNKEIGVHALRGGSVAGLHTVSFFGEDEELEITHRATSRKIFAMGAVMSAEKLMGKAPGYYRFEDILFGGN